MSGAHEIYSLRGKRVWVAGHNGMVGAALMRILPAENPSAILGVDRSKVDLRDQSKVESWMMREKPEVVIIAAAKVGGILANHQFPADFIYDNLAIVTNIVEQARISGVDKLLYLGSSCVYPKFAPQPIPESALLSGELEPTNEWYAIAKIAGIKLCQAYRRQYKCDYIAAMPTNLYGPGDNYHLETSHVIPALIRKAHEAKRAGASEMSVWGSGKPRREFLYVDDCARGLVHLLKHYSDEGHVNLGSGVDLSIGDLAKKVMNAVGFDGKLINDLSKPDGTPRKLMLADKMRAMGWAPKVTLEEGLPMAYEAFLENELRR